MLARLLSSSAKASILSYLLVNSWRDSVRRAVARTVIPRFANAIASSFPIPLLQPVMRAKEVFCAMEDRCSVLHVVTWI